MIFDLRAVAGGGERFDVTREQVAAVLEFVAQSLRASDRALPWTDLQAPGYGKSRGPSAGFTPRAGAPRSASARPPSGSNS